MNFFQTAKLGGNLALRNDMGALWENLIVRCL